MKVALAQMDVIPNRPAENVKKMLGMVSRAKEGSADLIAFPEMCIGGYLLSDRWQDSNFCRNLMEYNADLRDASSGIAIAYGNVFMDEAIDERVGRGKGQHHHHPNKDGRPRKYNAVYVFQDGKPAPRLRETDILPRGVEPKTLLPEYRIFDDERYYLSTQDIAKDFGVPLESLLQPLLVDMDGEPVPTGFELCEDMWCQDYRRNGEALDPTKILIENGARLVMNLSASPLTYGKNKTRDRRVQFLKSRSGKAFVPFFYVNCVGVQNNGKDLALFDGGSTVYNMEGLPVLFGDSDYNEQLLLVEDSDLAKEPLERVEPERTGHQFRGIVRGIRHMNDILGRTPRYVVGLSGGIDSAVVASLLTAAVGKENVIGVNMPTKYNRQESRDSSRHVAESLGIKYLVIPIAELVELNRRALLMEEGGGGRLSPLLEQNIQAKVRAQVLSNLAEKFGGLYTCNGNKWEIATGYSTLDGDARGALSPIGDMTKTEVFRMAEYLNGHHFHAEVIPRELIEMKLRPGAELEADQANPLKVGYHCALVQAFMDFKVKSAEDVMQWYVDGTVERNLGVANGLLRRYGLDSPAEFMRDLEWFNGAFQRSVFKRVQGSPIILLSKTAFGYDRRESILPGDVSLLYRRLRKKVLSMKVYSSSSSRP